MTLPARKTQYRASVDFVRRPKHRGHGLPGAPRSQERAKAIAAANSVDRKFTALFPSRRLRSRVAPKRLSSRVAAIAALAEMRAVLTSTTPVAKETAVTIATAKTPASVPRSVIAPSVPIGTRFPLVTRRGTPPTACPISLSTVSPVASASAATTAAANLGSWAKPYTTAQPAATARLANTCSESRPRRDSAVPSFSFREYPIRVEIQVSRKTVASARNPPQPTPRRRAKQTSAPARAPDVVTPRTSHANSAKTRVIPAALHAFGGRRLAQISPITAKLFIRLGKKRS